MVRGIERCPALRDDPYRMDFVAGLAQYVSRVSLLFRGGGQGPYQVSVAGRSLLSRPRPCWLGSHGDPELDGGKRDPGDSRVPASLGLPQRDETVGGQRLEIRMDILEIAAGELSELVDRVRPTLADHAE